MLGFLLLAPYTLQGLFKSVLDPTSTPFRWPELSPVSHSSGELLWPLGCVWGGCPGLTLPSLMDPHTSARERWLLKKDTTSSVTLQLKDNNGFLSSVQQVQLNHD